MALGDVPASILQGFFTQAEFDAYPGIILGAGQFVHLAGTDNYKRGDGVTVLSALPWRGTLNKTAADWTSQNPVLLAGQIGIETDTRKWKLGDGVTEWNALTYEGSGGLTEPLSKLDFDTTALPAHQAGRIHWSDDTKTIQIDTDVTDFMIEAGQMLVVRVRNTSGSTIAKGKAVYISGGSGNRPLITLATNATEDASACTLGLVARDIANNAVGYVVCAGLLRNVDTSAWTAGAMLYLGTNGNLVTSPPAAPAHGVRMGTVIYSHANNGIVQVHIMNGFEVDELHDVLITSIANQDVLLYDSASGLWKNSSINLFPPRYSGTWRGGLQTTGTIAANWAANVWFTSYIVGKAHNVTQIRIPVTTGVAGGSVRLAIYTDNNGAPGNLIEESGALAATAAGEISYAFSAPQAMSGQIIWMAFQASSNTIAVRYGAVLLINPRAAGTIASGGYSKAHVYGAFPASIATPSVQTLAVMTELLME